MSRLKILGRRIFSALLQIVGFLMLGWNPFSVSETDFDYEECETYCYLYIIAGYVVLAFSQSMLSVYWTCIPLITPVEQHATAFGLILAL